MIDGSILSGYVVVPIGGWQIQAVFTKLDVARDYLENETTRCEIKECTILLWENGTASLFDPRQEFRWDVSDDYNSGPTKELGRLKKQAVNKLSEAEYQALVHNKLVGLNNPYGND